MLFFRKVKICCVKIMRKISVHFPRHPNANAIECDLGTFVIFPVKTASFICILGCDLCPRPVLYHSNKMPKFGMSARPANHHTFGGTVLLLLRTVSL